MGRRDPSFLVVGYLAKAHGTKGEISVRPLTDHPEGTFAPGVVFRLGGKEAEGPDPDLPRLTLEHCRTFRDGYLVRFAGVDERSQAEGLRGTYLYRDADEVEPLAEGELFYHQLLDMEVRTADGQLLGRIQEVYEARPADLLEVQGESGQVMIPFLEHIVVEVDADTGRMVIDPPEGLLDL